MAYSETSTIEVKKTDLYPQLFNKVKLTFFVSVYELLNLQAYGVYHFKDDKLCSCHIRCSDL